MFLRGNYNTRRKTCSLIHTWISEHLSFIVLSYKGDSKDAVLRFKYNGWKDFQNVNKSRMQWFANLFNPYKNISVAKCEKISQNKLRAGPKDWIGGGKQKRLEKYLVTNFVN